MAERFAGAGTGNAGAVPIIIGFHGNSMTNGWRRWWREHIWRPRFQRVKVVCKAGQHWIAEEWIDGEGPLPPMHLGEGSMDIKAAMERQGWVVRDWKVGLKARPNAQRFGVTNNLTYALQRACIRNPINPWAMAYLAAPFGFELFAPLVPWLSITLFLLAGAAILASRRFSRPEHLYDWIEAQISDRVAQTGGDALQEAPRRGPSLMGKD